MKNGHSRNKVDDLEDLKRTACDSKLSKDKNLDGLVSTRYLQIQSNCGSSTLTLLNRPFLVKWASILIDDRPYWLKIPSIIGQDRIFRYKNTVRFDPRPSILESIVYFELIVTIWSDSIQSLLMSDPQNLLICSTKTMFWCDNKDVTLCLLHSSRSKCL